jgi:hypothetical protein
LLNHVTSRLEKVKRCESLLIFLVCDEDDKINDKIIINRIPLGGGRGSVLGVMRRLRDGSSRNCSSNPGKGKHFLFSLRYMGWLSGPPGLPFSGYWVYRLGRAADCSPLYNSRIGMNGAIPLFSPIWLYSMQ